MTVPRLLAAALLALTILPAAGAQESVPVLTLSQAVEQAMQGDERALVESGLRAARATKAAADAKNGFTVSASAGYGVSQAVNSPSLKTVTTAPDPYSSPSVAAGTASVGAATTDGILIQNPSASVTAGTPLTSVTGTWSIGSQMWPDGTSRTVSSASAKLSQVVWNGYAGGPLQAAADKAALAFEAAELSAQASRNKTVLAVKQAYYTMLSAQQNLELLQATLAARQTTAKFVQARYDLRQATEIDRLTAQVNERAARLDLADGQNALATARKRLANLLGWATETVFVAAEEPDPPAPAASLKDAVDQGLRHRPEPRVAELNARGARVDRSLAQGQSTPSVTVTGGVNAVVDAAASKSVVVGQIGVSLGAPLWDAGAAGSAVDLAEQNLAFYETQIRQLSRSIPVDIEEAWNAWQQAIGRYELARDNRRNYDLQLEVVRAQLDAGVKTLTDLFEAEVNASTADFGLLKAKITAQLAALQLQSLLGL